MNTCFQTVLHPHVNIFVCFYRQHEKTPKTLFCRYFFNDVTSCHVLTPSVLYQSTPQARPRGNYLFYTLFFTLVIPQKIRSVLEKLRSDELCSLLRHSCICSLITTSPRPIKMRVYSFHWTMHNKFQDRFLRNYDVKRETVEMLW